MNSYSRVPRMFAVMITVLMLASVVFAGDPPSRVMRLRYISGQISMQPGGVNDWVEAAINRPMTTADRVWADKDSRAELSLGTATLRIKDETSMTISNLNDNTVQVELDQGTLNIRVREMYPGEIYEIDTPNVAFTLQKPGEYRFEVDSERDETVVIVRKGEGEGTGDGRGVRVRSGEEVRFEHGDTLMHSTASARGYDGFDDWCHTRDKRENSAESLRYLPADVVGYEDLDEHGTWSEDPGYGPIWVPRHVAVDWAPYRYGHWVWIEPWGWTWVDDAPWGFAPFHYGRWVHVGAYWGWSPGPRQVRAVYAPALVAWVGGRNWGVGVSLGGGVGWVPLGFGEAYYPSYRVSERYVRNVNISNTRIVNITNVTNNYTIINSGRHLDERYANQHVLGAVTMVGQQAFANARPVASSRIRLSDRDAASAPGMRGAEIAPMRASVLGANQGRHASVPPAGVVGKPVWAKEHPPERPIAFERRQPVIERNGGRPLDDAQVNELRSRRSADVPTRSTQGAPSRGVGQQPNAAPEMRGQGGHLDRPADAEITRPGNRVHRPTDRDTAQQGVGVLPSERAPRVGSVDENRPTPVPAAVDRPSTGMRPTERMPRAQGAEGNATIPAAHPANDEGNSMRRDDRRGVPRPPRTVEGRPQVSQPAEVREHTNQRDQNAIDRGYSRQPQEVAPRRENNRPDRESRSQQNTNTPTVRPPAPQRSNDAPATRPEPQQRPQVQQQRQQQPTPPRQPQPKEKENRRNDDKAQSSNWHGRGGSRGE